MLYEIPASVHVPGPTSGSHGLQPRSWNWPNPFTITACNRRVPGDVYHEVQTLLQYVFQSHQDRLHHHPRSSFDRRLSRVCVQPLSPGEGPEHQQWQASRDALGQLRHSRLYATAEDIELEYGSHIQPADLEGNCSRLYDAVVLVRELRPRPWDSRRDRGAVVRTTSPDTLPIVDGITSIEVRQCRSRWSPEWGVDGCDITGSQKALMLPRAFGFGKRSAPCCERLIAANKGQKLFCAT